MDLYLDNRVWICFIGSHLFVVVVHTLDALICIPDFVFWQHIIAKHVGLCINTAPEASCTHKLTEVNVKMLALYQPITNLTAVSRTFCWLFIMLNPCMKYLFVVWTTRRCNRQIILKWLLFLLVKNSPTFLPFLFCFILLWLDD